MRKMTIIAEVSVKTLVDLDVLEDLIEDVILEALHQDQEVEVKVRDCQAIRFLFLFLGV